MKDVTEVLTNLRAALEKAECACEQPLGVGEHATCRRCESLAAFPADMPEVIGEVVDLLKEGSKIRGSYRLHIWGTRARTILTNLERR